MGGGGTQPADPKPVRMPVQNTVSYQQAMNRARKASSGRTGRDSTIMALRNLTGSIGKLGR